MKDIENKIRSVKESFGEILELSDLELTEIPKEVFELDNLKILRLRKNKIKFIPDDIEKLASLTELNLIDNEIETLPQGLFKLQNLQILHLRKNEISEIPKEIENLKNLIHLNLGDNQIKELPIEIGKLNNMITLFLKNNEITTLPRSLKDMNCLKELIISENPISYPPIEIIKGGLMRIIIFLILEDTNINESTSFTFKLPKELRTAIKQYISFFPDYVEIAKGKNVRFEVKSSDEGIIIEVSENVNLEEVNEYFNEYLSFVKTNLDTLQPKIETEISLPQRELLVLELKQQITHLRQQLDFKSFQVKFLEQQVDGYYNLLTIEKANPTPIYLQALSQSSSSSESSAESRSEITMNLTVEIPRLQTELLQTKLNIPDDASTNIKAELDSIDQELMEQPTITDVTDVNKVPLKKIKRLFDQLTEDDSELNSLIKKSKKFKETIQKLGKTYNKIAQWTALPVIPDLLLEI